MTGQSRDHHGMTGFFIVAGLILMLVGAASWLPTVNATDPEVTPADFGEDVPLVRPTVTPLPRSHQITPVPMLLPGSSAQNSDGSLGQTTTSTEPAGSSTPDRVVASPHRLLITAIGLDAPVEAVGWHIVNGVSQWDVPDHFAAGWLKTSALLGQVGNTVLTGHHNIAGEVFRYLVNLRPGDEIEVDAYSQVYFYKVTTRKIVQELGEPEAVRLENAKWMLPTDDERLTLITCWPYTSNTHRLIIVAKPFDPERNGKGALQWR
jgi:sortase A